MRLTSFTDYALRTLMYLGTERDRLVTIQEIAEAHDIAKNHLTKVVHQLGMLGYIDTVRGRNGGLRLGREPADINIGEVVRQTETDFYMAACFDQESAGCIYSAACSLKTTLARATQAFLDVLDQSTLEDMLVREDRKQKAGSDTGKKAAAGVEVVQLHYHPNPKRAGRR
jgi:Rrf2 family nitric oxide-sensitive transcriptional repressor